MDYEKNVGYEDKCLIYRLNDLIAYWDHVHYPSLVAMLLGVFYSHLYM